jgi:ferric-dicitrate binding protein FerR (iron transport regulator)
LTEARPASRYDEAARWFAALRRGVMSLEERAAYQAWCRDRANRAAITELERTWDSLGALREHLGEVTSATADAGAQARYGRPALVATMCAVSLVIGILSYSESSGFWTTLDWMAR